MTSQEREQYNALPVSEKKAYDFAKQQHPEWSHNQLMTKAKFSVEIDTKINDGKDPNKTDVFKDVLEKVTKWLKEIGVSEVILEPLNKAINYLNKTIKDGIQWIGDKLNGFIDWLF